MRSRLSTEWIRTRLDRHAKAARFSKFAPFRDDPVAFASDVLKLSVWERQREVLAAAGAHDFVLVKSGHKCSKSTSAVGLALWWCATRPGMGTRAVITAPSFNQVKNILWRELRLRWPTVEHDLGGEVPKDPGVGLEMASGAQIIGLSTATPENLAGISGENLLFIVDECSGYPDDLFEVLEGNSAGGAKFFGISNPTKTTGWFYEHFMGSGEDVSLHTISSEETPNVKLGRKVIPGIATREWIEKMRRKYGPIPEEHRIYQVRVRGEFPTTSEAQVIELRAMEAATKRWRSDDSNAYGPLRIGVDPAWYGSDDAVIAPARDDYVYPLEVLTGKQDGDSIAEKVVQTIRKRRRLPQDACVPVVVDGVNQGIDTVGALRRHEAAQNGELVVIVYEGFRPATEPGYTNQRTQVWFHLGRWMLERGALPPDPELRRELLGPSYVIDAQNRFEMESKRRFVKRMKKSPNRADAVTLAVSTIQPPEPDYLSDLPEDDEDDW